MIIPLINQFVRRIYPKVIEPTINIDVCCSINWYYHFMNPLTFRPETYEEIYNSINSILADQNIPKTDSVICGYLAQKITLKLWPTFLNGSLLKKNEKSPLTLEEIMKSNKLKYDREKIAPKLTVSLLQFIKFSLLVMFSVTYIFFMPKIRSNKKLNLVYGLSKELIYKNSLQINCIEFFADLQPRIIRADSQVLIQLQKILFRKKRNNQNFKVVLFIPLYLLRFNPEKRIKLIIMLFYKYVEIILVSIRNPVIFEVASEEIFQNINIKTYTRIDSLYTTVSQWAIQPLIFHSIKNKNTNMIWYSNNVVPFFNKIRNAYDSDLSYLKSMAISHHFVWTKTFGEIIRATADKKYTVKEYILFYLPKNQSIQKKYDVTIFDVTPAVVNAEYEYYSLKNCLKFLHDIRLVLNKLKEVKAINTIALKPKRKYLRIHSRQYLTYLKVWEKSEELVICNPDSNLFELISESRVILVMPLSSPALVAKHLGIPCCYFNPDKKYTFGNDYEGIEVINSKPKLLDFLKRNLG